MRSSAASDVYKRQVRKATATSTMNSFLVLFACALVLVQCQSTKYYQGGIAYDPSLLPLDAKCVVGKLGFDFMAVRVQYIELEKRVIDTILAANSVNLPVDILFNPCAAKPSFYSLVPWCASVDDQIGTFVRWLHGNQTQINRFWIDIDFNAGEWFISDPAKNLKFLEDALASLHALNIPTGIRANEFYWNYVFDTKVLSPTVPLWVINHALTSANITDWDRFGGFQTALVQDWSEFGSRPCNRAWDGAVSTVKTP
eukprot:TRINITY_DN5082_c0_g1_i1.p1 TRINITY_DN5082_c0_g1~~TRINITY_DN5082_c0_g1_i1.p1  ORF type:complete len:256 (-),score=35.14 TRINITY_DN5082_c0_g1_i1:26-793(-)